MSVRTVNSMLLFAWALVLVPACEHRLQETQSDAAGNGVLASEQSAPGLEQTSQLVFKGTNQFRKEENRAPLTINQQLTAAAQSFAEYLARTDKFSHTADGKEPWQRVAATAYDYCIVLENIAYEYNSAGFSSEELAEKLMEGWKHSPGHRKNMLDPDVQEIGIAIARSENTGRYYAVQDFGRPKSAMISFKLTNQSDTRLTLSVNGKESNAEPDVTYTFEDCRPPELPIHWPKGAKVGQGAKEVIRPSAGSHYIIRNTDGASFTVRAE